MLRFGGLYDAIIYLSNFTVRNMSADLNRLLMDLGSGPNQEANENWKQLLYKCPRVLYTYIFVYVLLWLRQMCSVLLTVAVKITKHCNNVLEMENRLHLVNFRFKEWYFVNTIAPYTCSGSRTLSTPVYDWVIGSMWYVALIHARDTLEAWPGWDFMETGWALPVGLMALWGVSP